MGWPYDQQPKRSGEPLSCPGGESVECSRLSSLQGRRAAGQWTRPSPSCCSRPAGLVPRRCLPGLPMPIFPAPSSGTGGQMPPAPWQAPSRAQGLTLASPTACALGMVLLAAALPLDVSPAPPGSLRSGDRCQGTRGQALTSPGWLSPGDRGAPDASPMVRKVGAHRGGERRLLRTASWEW